MPHSVHKSAYCNVTIKHYLDLFDLMPATAGLQQGKYYGSAYLHQPASCTTDCRLLQQLLVNTAFTELPRAGFCITSLYFYWQTQK